MAKTVTKEEISGGWTLPALGFYVYSTRVGVREREVPSETIRLLLPRDWVLSLPLKTLCQLPQLNHWWS